jgi:maltooligosyltrehalose trehalohydrolase
VPDPQDPATHARSVLRWEERGSGRHADMLEWYRALLALRQATPDLLDPALTAVRCRRDADAGWFLMERGAILVAFSLAQEPVELEVSGELLLASEPGVTLDDGRLRLVPDAVAVARTDR